MIMVRNELSGRGKKAVALIITILILIVLGTISIVILTRGVSESNFTRRFAVSTKAFWLAEAGVNWALKELGNNFNSSGTSSPVSLGGGTYSVSIAAQDANTRKVTAEGSMPVRGGFVKRRIEALVKKKIPANFYDQPVYSAGDVDFNGSSYTVASMDSNSSNIAVIYAGNFSVEHPENIIGRTVDDPSISPLAHFDFQELYDISSSQGNVYDADRLKDVQQGRDSFPSSFWYSAPTDPSDPSTGTPNIVYVTSDLQLNGNIGIIGGFFVVVGDVITNPDASDDTTINGNGVINGVIYTLGEFDVNGGGGNLNVNGGVWAGDKVRLNGNAAIEYNREYMEALQDLNINPGVYIYSWKDLSKPYKL